MNDRHHLTRGIAIRWDEIESGTKLTKFIAVDEAKRDGDRTVTLHGFYTDSGEVLITDEIIELRQPPSPAAREGESNG